MAKKSAQLLFSMTSLMLVSLAMASSLSVGARAPDFALPGIDGANLRLSEYRSEVVVLNFWAPWCNKCRDAIQSLDSLYRERQQDGLQVLAVGVDGDSAKARRYVSDIRASFPVLNDDQRKSVSRMYDPGQLPMTVLIDREGNVRFVHKGFREDSQRQIEAELNALLSE